MSKQNNSEQALTKKVWTLADVIAAAGVGFTDYIIQLTERKFVVHKSEFQKMNPFDYNHFSS
jgi:type I restriction enzyme M protein